MNPPKTARPERPPEPNILRVKTVSCTPAWFSLLEKRGLIKTLRPTAKIRRSKNGRGDVDTVYCASRGFGAHKLICVRPDSSVPQLNSHPDNEEFILMDTGENGPSRPLHLLLGLWKHDVLRKKAREGTLAAEDFVLLKMAFNRARYSVFTMCRDTVHCEIVFPGRAKAPVFFVTEPDRLPMNFLRLPGYAFCFSRGGRNSLNPPGRR